MKKLKLKKLLKKIIDIKNIFINIEIIIVKNLYLSVIIAMNDNGYKNNDSYEKFLEK